jgi:cytochrome P450
MSQTTLPPKFDALDPAVLEDPYPRYAQLRAAGPLCRSGPGTWMVTRYAELAALLSHSGLSNRLPPEQSGGLSIFGTGPAGVLTGRMLSGLEPPEHTVVRQLLHAALGPKLIRDLRRHIAGLVDELLEPVCDRGGFDAVSELAFPLQALVVCELLGIPRADRELIWPDAVRLGRTFIPYRIPTSQQTAEADEIAARLRAYMQGLLTERRASMRDDLVTCMQAAVERGAVAADLAVDNLVFLCFAGFETTMNVIGTMCALLPTHPDQWARLRADRSLVPTAVEEFLRYDAPAQYTVRLTRERLEIGGRTIRPGRMLLLVMGSANRDERQFNRPDRLDVTRHPNPHVSFGGGHHHCVGWAVGKAICEVALAGLLRRFVALEAAAPPVRLHHPNFRAHQRVPVVVTPA